MELELKGFQRDKVVRYLDANNHNHQTTCYYLILEKMERNGQIDSRKYFSGENFLKKENKMDMEKQYLNKDQLAKLQKMRQLSEMQK